VTPFFALWLALAVAPAPVPVAASETDAAADLSACPPPVRGLPRYPMDALRANRSGVTLVLARIDACGRVVESRIHTPSGHPQMDEAAHDAVKGWVLSPAERERIGGEWVKLPVKFGGVTTYYPKRVDWPESHRRPHYVADPGGIGYPDLAAFYAARRLAVLRPLKSPYARVTDRIGTRVLTSFYPDVEDDRTFWMYFTQLDEPLRIAAGKRTIESRVVAVARYRLDESAQRPIVQVGLLCDLEPGACDELRAFLLEGLPIARPPRR
jgi:TonB family protein